MKMRKRGLTIAVVLAVGGGSAMGWDEEGHAIIARLGHAKLPERMPAWVRTQVVDDRLVYLSTEPDRWRGQKSADLDHANNPDHYFDVEELARYELTLKTLPPLRREFTDLLATARAKNPRRFPHYDREKDKDYTHLVPGLLPYNIAELQWKLAASWTTLKTYEANPELVPPNLLDNARQNVVYQMGILSHFVGDGSQPLHTSKHHHGWVGDNPKGYTTDKKIHRIIDGEVIEVDRITSESLMNRARPPRKVTKDNYFSETCDYLNESYMLVEPVYELEKGGDLWKPAGKKFIEDRLLEGGAMLAGVWTAAYDAAIIDEFRVNQLKRKAEKGDGPSKSAKTTP